MKRLLSWFARTFGWLGERIAHGLRMAEPFYKPAAELCQLAQQYAGPAGRTIADVLAFLEAAGVPAALADGKVAPEELELVIREGIRIALARQFPDAPNRRLNRAIEAAYGAINP